MIRVKENDPLFIYLLMNIVFIGVAMTMFTGTAVTGIAIGFGLYLFSMSMRSLRLERIKDPEVMSRLVPTFQTVYVKARQMNQNLSDDT